MTTICRLSLVVLLVASLGLSAAAQPLGEPDRGAPGDEMIQAYLARETAKLSAKFSEDVKSLEAWQAKRPQYVEEYYYMLGLSPRPEKTPLKATVTGTYKGDGYDVEMLHYQSRPRLYVTGNLYRPAAKAGEKLPAVFYVCGHSGRGRNGNKVAYQSHGIWFARHGYVCLVVDTLQLGEIAAIHHGTYNLNRWWWHSRGYTPAGVEAWNGVRGIDYLVSRRRRRSRADRRHRHQRRRGGDVLGRGGRRAGEGRRARQRHGRPGVVRAQPRDQRPLRLHVPLQHVPVALDADRRPRRPAADAVRQQRQGPHLPDGRQRADHQSPGAALQPVRRGRPTSTRSSASAATPIARTSARRRIGFINAHLKGDARPVTDSEIDIVSEGRDPGPVSDSAREAARLSHRRRPARRPAQHEDRRALRAAGQSRPRPQPANSTPGRSRCWPSCGG